MFEVDIHKTFSQIWVVWFRLRALLGVLGMCGLFRLQVHASNTAHNRKLQQWNWTHQTLAHHCVDVLWHNASEGTIVSTLNVFDDETLIVFWPFCFSSLWLVVQWSLQVVETKRTLKRLAGSRSSLHMCLIGGILVCCHWKNAQNTCCNLGWCPATVSSLQSCCKTTAYAFEFCMDEFGGSCPKT